jgi:hypothetical protein
MPMDAWQALFSAASGLMHCSRCLRVPLMRPPSLPVEYVADDSQIGGLYALPPRDPVSLPSDTWQVLSSAASVLSKVLSLLTDKTLFEGKRLHRFRFRRLRLFRFRCGRLQRSRCRRLAHWLTLPVVL